MLHSSRTTDPIDGHLGVDVRCSEATWEHFAAEMGRFEGVWREGKHVKNNGGVIKIKVFGL